MSVHLLGSESETPLAPLVVEEHLHKIGLGEIGPEFLCDGNLGVGNLPKQEVGNAEVAPGAYKQVGVGASCREGGCGEG